MNRISENELVLPALHLIENETNGLTTTELIVKLRELLNPQGEDLSLIEGRNDDKFSQKVRNLRVHRTLERNNYCTFEPTESRFKITQEGKQYLLKNSQLLNSIIDEEILTNLYSTQITSYFDEFNSSITILKNLLSNNSFQNEDKDYFFNMIYVSIIVSFETYLSDAIKVNMNKKEDYLRIFVETFQDYESKKIPFRNIFSEYLNVGSIVQDSLSTILYHNLPKVKTIYENVFGITFGDYSVLMPSITIRHDLVHRNGKKHDGTKHTIKITDLNKLMSIVEEFVENIETQLSAIS